MRALLLSAPAFWGSQWLLPIAPSPPVVRCMAPLHAQHSSVCSRFGAGWHMRCPPLLQVWRILFWAMAALAVATCALVLTNAVEPRSYYRRVADARDAPDADAKQPPGREPLLARARARVGRVFVGVGRVFRTPTFILIMLGNIIGTIVAGNMGYKIMYMQVGGSRCLLPSCCCLSACMHACASLWLVWSKPVCAQPLTRLSSRTGRS